MKIDIIAPALPPQLDGIGDYTALLAAELASQHDISIITTDLPTDPILNVSIYHSFTHNNPHSNWKIIDQVVIDKPDWVVLQYNPFAYGKRGLNLELPKVMRSIKNRLPSTRIALMVHEPFLDIESWQWAIMTTWQRWQFLSLGMTADVVFLSIELWTRKFQRWFPNKPVIHLPVGSNVPANGLAKEVSRASLGIPSSAFVLGFFGQAHGSRMFNYIQESSLVLRAKGVDVQILCIGAGGEHVRSSFGDTPLTVTGRVSADDVSNYLSAIDVYLSVFVDGVSTRRGSMMAGMQHGLPIVGTIGPKTDVQLIEQNNKALLLIPVGSNQLFTDAISRLNTDCSERNRLGEAARSLFENQFAWNKIASKMISALE